MPSQRLNKVAEAIKEEVAQILQQELKDPRIGFITITQVRITADLQHATIYFSVLPSKGGLEPSSTEKGHKVLVETEAGLKSAQGFIRKLLGERLRLRVTPELHFRSDPSVEENIRMSKLIDELNKPEDS